MSKVKTRWKIASLRIRVPELTERTALRAAVKIARSDAIHPRRLVGTPRPALPPVRDPRLPPLAPTRMHPLLSRLQRPSRVIDRIASLSVVIEVVPRRAQRQLPHEPIGPHRRLPRLRRRLSRTRHRQHLQRRGRGTVTRRSELPRRLRREPRRFQVTRYDRAPA